MKLKRLPADFRVEELPTVRPARQGRFTFYRLEKTGIGTPEAIEAIRRRWNLAANQISYGGMKDRHAATVQYITIAGGPARPLRQEHLGLEPIGYLNHPYTPRDFRGNRFWIVMRDLSDGGAERAAQALTETRHQGLPNYFDDQRFGSVGHSGEFVAEAWLRGDPERALWLALAEHNVHDRPETRAEKETLRDTWGRWAEAKERLPRSHSRSIVTYLVDHPSDFRGAFARVNRTQRSLVFSAYQSHLWNVVIGRLITELVPAERCVWNEFETARLPIPTQLDDSMIAEFAGWRLPLPSSRSPLPDGRVGEVAAAVLAERGLEWSTLRVKHLKDVFFSKGVRPARFVPEDLNWEISPDDLYPGRIKLTMSFGLPKGSYATIVVKRVTL